MCSVRYSVQIADDCVVLKAGLDPWRCWWSVGWAQVEGPCFLLGQRDLH